MKGKERGGMRDERNMSLVMGTKTDLVKIAKSVLLENIDDYVGTTMTLDSLLFKVSDVYTRDMHPKAIGHLVLQMKLLFKCTEYSETSKSVNEHTWTEEAVKGIKEDIKNYWNPKWDSTDAYSACLEDLSTDYDGKTQMYFIPTTLSEMRVILTKKASGYEYIIYDSYGYQTDGGQLDGSLSFDGARDEILELKHIRCLTLKELFEEDTYERKRGRDR